MPEVDALQGVPKGLRPVEVDTRHGDADWKADLGGPPRQGDDVQVIGRKQVGDSRSNASGRAGDCDTFAARGRMKRG
jgi:hypothetical protein